MKKTIIALTVSVALGLAPTVVLGADGNPSGIAPTISPLPGTPDASPHSQISFLGAPASELHGILVKGSRSSVHRGRLETYASASGASFIPTHPFLAGEQVSVRALLGSGAEAETLTSSFTVADTYTLPSESGKPSGNSALAQGFHSRHDLRPPRVTITTAAADPALGDILISPDSGAPQAGPMIIEPSGALVWFQPMPSGTEATNLRVQQYLGQPVLTWWQGQVIGGHGQGEDVIENAAYQPIARIHAGNGLYADLHEFQITPAGTALISSYEPVHYDLSAYGGSRNGLVDDCVVQEIDIKTGLVMFEWHALGHVKPSESYARVPHLSADVFDFFHINSIQLQSDGDLLVGARNTWTAYMIDGHSGTVLWRLGGKHSSFTLGPGVRFAWQHDAEMDRDGALSIFDNEDSPQESQSSRAIRVALDFANKTATLLDSYEHPGTRILSPSQGNVQLLANEDRFVGWGQAGYVSEFSPAGQLTFDMRLPAPVNSYRAFRDPWSGRPDSSPALVTAPSKDGTVTVYCSWNGASEVSSWRLRAGRSQSALASVSTVPRHGFESQLFARGSKLYLQVQALGGDGQVLGTSKIVKSS